MKRMLALLLIFMSASINGTIWNTPDYSQPQTVVVEEQPVRVVVQQPVYRSGHYHPGRPVTTAVEGAGNTVDAAAQGVSNIVHSDRPVRAAVDGAVDTADTAVESAANTIRSIFR
jgi:hypothetical protein